jgi:hypothetical protein
MTRLQLSGTGHIVFGLIALWGILILVTAEMEHGDGDTGMTPAVVAKS